MIKSTAVEIMRSFSKEDISRFGELAASPYFNKKSAVLKLYNLLKKNWPAYDEKKITKEALWEKLYPGKQYNYGVMKNLIHDITKLAEEYLVQAGMKNSGRSPEFLIRELLRRENYRLFEDRLSRFGKEAVNPGTDALTNYNKKIFYHNMRNLHLIGSTMSMPFLREEAIDKVSHFMISYFETFSHLCEEDLTLDASTDIKFAGYVADFWNSNVTRDFSDPVLELYLMGFSLLRDLKNEALFNTFNESLEGRRSNLNRLDIIKLHACKILFYEHAYRNGNSNFEKDFLGLWLDIIENNLYSEFDGSFLDLALFRNVIILSSRNKDHYAMEKFIESGIKKLKEPHRVAAKNYALMMLHSLKKDFDKTLYYAAKTSYGDLFDQSRENLYFKNDIKTCSVKSSYEAGHFEEVYSLIDSFGHFLRNTKLLPEDIRSTRAPFLKILKELNSLNFSYDAYKLDEIEQRAEKMTFQKNWLKLRIMELRSRNE